MLSKTLLATLILALIGAGFLDTGLHEWIGFPRETLLSAIMSRSVALRHLPIPAIGFVVIIILMGLLFAKWWLPAYTRKYRNHVDRLINIETPYSEHMWSAAREAVLGLLRKTSLSSIFTSHQRNMDTINKFTREDLQHYFKTIR
jgi:hypothetical protein